MSKKEINVFKGHLRPSQVRNLWLGRIFIWISIVITMIPIFFVVTASLAKGNGFFQASIIPSDLSFENYTKVIKDTDFLIWVKNSMIICTAVATLQLLMTATGAYAFSRMKFGFRKNGLLALLVLQMFPGMMTISAILGLAYKLNFLDNLYALILLFVGGSAYNVWLLKGFMDGLPRELDEAAMVDGATHWQIFWKIIMPLSKPMLAVIFLFCFIGIYSEFPLSSALLKSPENLTLTIGMRNFINNQFSANWTQYSAAAVMATVPITAIFMFLQKFIAKGLTAGAVKG